MKIRFGYRDMGFPCAELVSLRDSNDLLGNVPALQERLADDGYLLLRGLIDRGKVLKARSTILTPYAGTGGLVPNTPVLEGVMGGRSPRMMGTKGIAHHEDILAVLEGEELFGFFDAYFGEASLTYHYKWLRGVGDEQYTGAHYDFVYMGRGSANLHTTWVPLGDIPVDQGTLAMSVGSNRLESFAPIRDTYGRMDVDRDHVEGWFTRDPMEIAEKFGGQWATTDFFAGDVILFAMHTMHASTTNLTNRFRLSCDIRFQPASDPVDERWRKNGTGHAAQHEPVRSMADARSEWGV